MQEQSAPESSSAYRIARFGPFELNLTKAELRRQGRPVTLQQQSVRILSHLVEHAGDVVGREELQAAVWPPGTFVEFEGSLYTAVNRLRQALGDSATNPYFIETVPKVGYRFISPVQITAPASEVAPEPVASTTAVAPPRTGASRSTVYLWTAAVLLSALGVWILWNRTQSRPPVLDNLRPFTTTRGIQDQPSFSPNGEMIAFQTKNPGDLHTGIYVQRLDAATAVRISKGAYVERHPVWSRDGQQIAFLRDNTPDTFAIVSSPLVGIEERKWVEFNKGAAPWFDWSPDGNWFAIAESPSRNQSPGIELISTINGERRVLTQSPAGWHGDSNPAFSPDSKYVVFRRTMPSSGIEDLYQVPVKGGEIKRLTFDNRMASGLAFLPDQSLIFVSKRGSSIPGLWWLSPRRDRFARLTEATIEPRSPAASRDGKHIAFSKVTYDVNIWRINTDGNGAAQLLVDSPLNDSGGEYSPDGRRIAFHSNRSGTDEIWVCNADGSAPVRLTDGKGAMIGNPKWSPDGRSIAYEWQPTGTSEIYVISSDGGTPRKLAASSVYGSVPSWSHDGRFIYYSFFESGTPMVRKAPVNGGAVVSLNLNGVAPRESPDGKNLYFFHSSQKGEVWRVPLTNGEPAGKAELITSAMRAGDWGNWTPDNEGIFFATEDGTHLQYLKSEGKSVRTLWTYSKRPLFGDSSFALSPDGKTLLFSQIDQDESNIFVQ